MAENMRGCDTKIKLCFVMFVAWVKKKKTLSQVIRAVQVLKQL